MNEEPHSFPKRANSLFMQLLVGAYAGVATAGMDECWRSQVDTACRVRKLSSRGDAVFVDEAAEPVAAVDTGRGRIHDVDS
jgi:hypothetical protein